MDLHLSHREGTAERERSEGMRVVNREPRQSRRLVVLVQTTSWLRRVGGLGKEELKDSVYCFKSCLNLLILFSLLEGLPFITLPPLLPNQKLHISRPPKCPSP